LGVADPSQVQAVGGKPSSMLVFAWQRPILCKQFVADAHFYIVGLTGEDHQRLVLGFPAEAADGAVVAVVVEGAAHADVVIGIGRIGIGGAVGVKEKWESDLTYRTIGRDERRYGIGAAAHDSVDDHLAFRIGPDLREYAGTRAGSARGRLGMTCPAPVRVEPR